METRPLGRTGLAVTPIGLGLAALGRPAYIDLGRQDDLGEVRSVEVMRARCHDVLDAAWQAGIRYVDAARSYGRAEGFLADWLEAHPSAGEELTIGSKWGYTYVADWRADADVHEVKDHSLGALRRQAGESLGLLGERLAVYQIHSATLDSGVLEDHAVHRELARLRDEHDLAIGLSVSGPGQAASIMRALDVEVEGMPLFTCVQATWNPLEPSAGVALGRARDAERGVIVKEALANGRLAGREPGRVRDVLDACAARLGVPIDHIALAAALAQPWADVVLSGAVTSEQVRSNVAAAATQLDDATIHELGRLAEEPEMYWSHRSALAWS